MTIHRRQMLQKAGGALFLSGLGGCNLPSQQEGSNETEGAPSESEVATFEYESEEVEVGLDTIKIIHADGQDLSANEVFISGIAFDWPPQRPRGFSYPWHKLSEIDSETGIGGKSVEVHPALVDSIRVLLLHDDAFTLLSEYRISDCNSAVACFEHIHQGADDSLDHLTVRHVSGRNLTVDNVYITGIATEYPPEPEKGERKSWEEVSDLQYNQGIAGSTIQVKIGLIEKVQILWQRNSSESVLEEFQLY